MVLKYLQQICIKKIQRRLITRVSNKKLYNKEHSSYKHYVFYEDGNEYIPLKTTLF